ncbi:hypothetical protein HY004_00855 [Candidatus Saccharibacteria bacterium]|nr:hypothetical protein [Candidatus Saccharibacteria bacterium]
MVNVITPKRFENTNYTIESVPVEFETHQPSEPEVYKVSERDTQTIGGKSAQFEVSADVIDMVQALRIKDRISNRNRSLSVARSSTRG